MNILAIDQGTSATKAVVLSDDDEFLSEVSVPLNPVMAGDGRVEQDPEELWRSVWQSGREAIAKASVPVDAVGLANQGETVVRWNPRDGQAFGAALSWQDRRASVVCERLACHGSSLAAITGLPLDPYFSAPKMAWLKSHYGGEGVVTTTDTWLLHRMTGEFITDATTASRSMLLDLDQVTWSPTACEYFGLDQSELPEIVDCAENIGQTECFGPDLPVTGLITDQQAALFAQDCLQTGDAKCTYGTGAFLLMTLGSRPTRSRHGLATCLAWKLDKLPTYCLDGQVYTAAAAISWLERLGLIATVEDLDRISNSVNSTNGVTFVPALTGLAAPYWRPSARGVFGGLALDTRREHLVRAVLEGIAASVCSLVDAAISDTGTQLARLQVDGGLTRSNALMQIQADLLQIPLEVFYSPDATVLGVGRLARRGLTGAGPRATGSYRAASPVVYEPAITPAEAAERLGQWQRMVEATSAL